MKFENGFNGFVSFHLGCDLGKQADFTAICFLQKRTPVDGRGRPNAKPNYEILTMKRFDLKTPYTEIVKQISNRLRREPFDSFQDNFGNVRPRKVPTHLCFDQTGTGAAVAELLKNDKFLENRLESLTGINITSGREMSEGSDFLNVPKKDLIFAAVVAFEQGDLQFAGDMPELSLLIEELQSFEMKFTAKGNDIYNAKSGKHDDLVLALSLAIWSAKNTDDSSAERETLSQITHLFSGIYSRLNLYIK